MNSKLNISKWLFLAMALVTVVIAVLFYLVVGTIKPQFELGNPTPRADLYLNWGYILIGLGILVALISVFFTAAVKGVNGKTILIAVIAVVVFAAIAYFLSRGTLAWARECFHCKALRFMDPNIYPDDMKEGYKRLTYYFVDLGINFFYVTLGGAVLSILFSVIYKAVKK